jgi:predicted AlkP superfamily phosphohydrolase/phosphomutase
MTERVLLIGLDGGTFATLDSLIDEGIMPFLKEFVAAGVRATLRSVIPPLTPPGWTSLVTGRTPGNHGVIDFFRFESPDTHYLRLVDSRDVKCETIWSILGRQGLRSTVLNFPLMTPPRPLAGNAVPGWAPWRHLPRLCFPRGLYDKLKAVPGFNVQELAMDLKLEGKAIEGSAKDEYEDWILFHIRRERQWFEILRYLMQEDPCDLTAVLFDGVDKLQHLLWRFIDPTYVPAHPSIREQKIRELCLNYFRQLDGLLAEAVAMAGPKASVFLASDHGFGPSTEVFYLNAWLHQQGYLVWSASAFEDTSEAGRLGLGRISQTPSMIDWSRTTAYGLTPSSNGVHVDVTGRRGRQGIEPAAYEALRARLQDQLCQLTDPTTGERVVSQALTREEAFPGAQMERAPDLTLSIRDGGFVSILKSDVVLKPRPEVVGTHRPEGIFIAQGPRIRRGLKLPALSITDVAPTLLYTLDLAVPRDMEGRVAEQIFEAAVLQQRPIRVGESTQVPGAFPQWLAHQEAHPDDQEGEAQVLERLKNLGYVE